MYPEVKKRERERERELQKCVKLFLLVTSKAMKIFKSFLILQLLLVAEVWVSFGMIFMDPQKCSYISKKLTYYSSKSSFLDFI